MLWPEEPPIKPQRVLDESREPISSQYDRLRQGALLTATDRQVVNYFLAETGGLPMEGPPPWEERAAAFLTRVMRFGGSPPLPDPPILAGWELRWLLEIAGRKAPAGLRDEGQYQIDPPKLRALALEAYQRLPPDDPPAVRQPANR